MQFILASEITMVNWLTQQIPVVVVMGIVIWWLAKRYEKANNEKEVLAKEVIKLTTLWEEKASELSKKSNVSDEKLEAIHEELSNIKTEIRILAGHNKL